MFIEINITVNTKNVEIKYFKSIDFILFKNIKMTIIPNVWLVVYFSNPPICACGVKANTNIDIIIYFSLPLFFYRYSYFLRLNKRKET